MPDYVMPKPHEHGDVHPLYPGLRWCDHIGGWVNPTTRWCWATQEGTANPRPYGKVVLCPTFERPEGADE